MLDVKDVRIVEKVSKKSGNPYQVLEVVFGNGYIYSNFLTQEQVFIIKMNDKK